MLITGIDSGSGQKDTLSNDDRTKVLGNVGFANADAWELKEESAEEATAKPAKKAAAPKAAAPAKKAAPKKAAGAAKAKKTK